MSMCRVFSCVAGRGRLLWPVHSLGKTLLAFALLHSVLQGQICLLLQVSLDLQLLHSGPWWWKVQYLEKYSSAVWHPGAGIRGLASGGWHPGAGIRGWHQVRRVSDRRGGKRWEMVEQKDHQQQEMEGAELSLPPDAAGTGSASLPEPDACSHLWKFTLETTLLLVSFAIAVSPQVTGTEIETCWQMFSVVTLERGCEKQDWASGEAEQLGFWGSGFSPSGGCLGAQVKQRGGLSPLSRGWCGCTAKAGQLRPGSCLPGGQLLGWRGAQGCRAVASSLDSWAGSTPLLEEHLCCPHCRWGIRSNDPKHLVVFWLFVQFQILFWDSFFKKLVFVVSPERD